MRFSVVRFSLVRSFKKIQSYLARADFHKIPSLVRKMSLGRVKWVHLVLGLCVFLGLAKTIHIVHTITELSTIIYVIIISNAISGWGGGLYKTHLEF